jgi:IclR family transcriptional regulator, acetate operon repressor
MEPKSFNSVKSAARVLDLLEYFSDADRPPSFIDISRDLRIPKSSLSHLLADLTKRGYVEHLPDIARYRLGPALKVLVRRAERPRLLEDLLMPVLRRLNERLNETNAFYVLKDDQVAVVATESGKQPLTYQMQVGHMAPLHAFSAGKVALSSYSDADLKRYFSQVKRRRRTERTICDEPSIRRQLKQIRSTGYGYSRSEHTRGVVGTARAVIVDGEFVGVLNISVPEARMDERMLSAVQQELRKTADEIVSILRRAGYHQIDRPVGHGHNGRIGVGTDNAGHH